MAHALTGNKILAQDFIDVVDLYDTFWRDPKDSIGAVITYSFDANHVGPADGRDKGWGQDSVTPRPNPQTVIEAEQINELLSHVNSGLYHIDNSSSLFNHFASVDIIEDDHLNDIENEIQVNIDSNKLNLGILSGADTYTTVGKYVDIDNNAVQWDVSIFCEAKWCFTTYTEARHFFNSGGSLVIDLTSGIGPWSNGKGNSALPVNTNRVTNGQPTNPNAGGGTNGSDDWHEIFRSIGEIHYKAKICQRTGSNGIEGDGFYGLAYDGSSNEVFSASGFGPYAYAYSYVYRQAGGPYNSSYGDRAVRIEMRGSEDTNTGEFCIIGKIILNEDPDDTYYVDTRIVASCYSIQPVDAPGSAVMSSSNASKFQAGGNDHIFLERAAPEVTLENPWT